MYDIKIPLLKCCRPARKYGLSPESERVVEAIQQHTEQTKLHFALQFRLQESMEILQALSSEIDAAPTEVMYSVKRHFERRKGELLRQQAELGEAIDEVDKLVADLGGEYCVLQHNVSKDDGSKKHK